MNPAWKYWTRYTPPRDLVSLSSSEQIWSADEWIHELSNYATLHPGDVIWMGTEGAEGDMVPGDTIEVAISGIGTLRNYVVAEE